MARGQDASGRESADGRGEEALIAAALSSLLSPPKTSGPRNDGLVAILTLGRSPRAKARVSLGLSKQGVKVEIPNLKEGALTLCCSLALRKKVPQSRDHPLMNSN
jgi:hypothetical protein